MHIQGDSRDTFLIPTIANWENGEDTTITKFCNSCNPLDLTPRRK